MISYTKTAGLTKTHGENRHRSKHKRFYKSAVFELQASSNASLFSLITLFCYEHEIACSKGFVSKSRDTIYGIGRIHQRSKISIKSRRNMLPKVLQLT